MKPVLISESLRQNLDATHKFALQNHHDYLDTPHLIYILARDTEDGRNWLNSIGCKDSGTFLYQFKSDFLDTIPKNTGYAEPTEDYLICTKQAQELARETNSAEITAAHILKVVVEKHSDLTPWLRSRGFTPITLISPIETPLVDRLGRDLTQLAHQCKLKPVIGREAESTQLIEALLRHGKNSVILLGAPGTGKTAVVEKLAQDIISNRVPVKLKGIRLVEFNNAALVAGTTYRGEFEERLQTLIEEIRRAKNIIMVIDEFHTLIGAGGTKDGNTDAANILKPALARGEITCIGITTNEEYRRFIEHDGALTRRLFPISVSEPSTEETLTILEGIAPDFVQHHGIQLDPQSLTAVVKWSDRFLSSRHFPDKAIDILAKAFSRAEIQKQQTVTENLIADIVSEITGVPVGNLSSDIRQSLADLEDHLTKTIIGQDDAIIKVSRAVRVAYAGLRDPQRPRGVFLFVGPSGVGKTQLARSLTRHLFGTEQSLIRLDMSEYAEKYTVSRLIGAAPGYIGHDEPGQLTQPLRERSACIVLLDEVEKAHPEVFDIFLQLFDAGRITDSHGNTADARNAFFIMTSNLGAATKSSSSLGFSAINKDPQIDYEQAVRSFFRPELINRIDHIINFRPLDADDFVEIVALELQTLEIRLQDQHLRLTYEQNVIENIAKRITRSEAGARGIKQLIEEVIAVPMSEMVIKNTIPNRRWLHLQMHNEQIIMEWM